MPSVEETEIVEYFDDLLAHLPLKEKFLIRCLLALLEVQMLAFNGTKPRLFSEASLEERTRNLAGWESSRFFQRRLVFMAIRTLLLWGYADSQEVERGMGFVPGTQRTKERNDARLAAARRAIAEATGRDDGNDGSSSAPSGNGREQAAERPKAPSSSGNRKTAAFSAVEDQA